MDYQQYFTTLNQTGNNFFNFTQNIFESYPEKVIGQIKEQQDLLTQTTQKLNKIMQNPAEWNKLNEVWTEYFNQQSQQYQKQVSSLFVVNS